ncbi:MAG: TraR/DksA C4-type zinc finger protein [Candidatus Omnitrophica bacterium]|nr:TraR/DksA C4-type zinc finger protein [Candidatus Omnitrophota bacterium]MCA9405603.1 TraR/DksA C4-type zinc finger protein [Candidatus Omnitrophota bacterium]
MPTKKTSKAKAVKKPKKLTKKELEYFKKLLFQSREEHVQDLKNMSDESNSKSSESSDVSGHVQHMADVATDMYDKEFTMGLASKDREILQKIEEALKRIDDGTYGICLEKGEAINKARLEAIPYAEYCLTCQEELENKR